MSIITFFFFHNAALSLTHKHTKKKRKKEKKKGKRTLRENFNEDQREK